MSIEFAGLCGPSYHLGNRFASVERLVNWFCTPNESPEEKKWQMALEPCPGNAAFCSLPVAPPYNQPNRGLLECRGVLYGVNGGTAFSMDSHGNFTNIGAVQADNNPASMVANGNGQIFIASGGQGYVIPPGGGAASLIPLTANTSFLGASIATFQDGYIIVVTPNSNQFQISGTDDVPLGDATLWDAANVTFMTGQADILSAVLSWREYLYLFGKRRTQVFYDAGAAGIGGFPFQSYSAVYMETGIDAPYSLQEVGDSLLWIGSDTRGVRACWRCTTFLPQRTSTYAVEQAWQNYPTLSDAIACSYLWMGHLFYQVTFPTANATWVYDLTASTAFGRPLWFERQYTASLGQQVARPDLFHAYCYGLHLVGSGGADGNPGAIYQLSSTAYSDCGVDATGAQAQRPIVRDRICPHVWQSNKRVIYNRFELELARGIGLEGTTFPTNPLAMLRWSNDGGNTWNRELSLLPGKIGQYGPRVYLNRLGYSRDRVFWLRCSDPVYWGILGAELDITPCSA